MKSYLALLILLLLPLTFGGCGDANPDAPPTNSAHPSSWISTHPESALATANFSDCTSCHASDLQGNGAAVSCYSCHAFNSDTNFVIHPATWTDTYIDHRGFASINGTTTCAKCHGPDLLGSPAAPSCFSASFDGLGCHADGPGSAPHPLDSSYLAGAAHGPDAEADLTACQVCHGESGGPGTNPRFNIGINSISGTGCEGCHGVNYAHPATWASPGPLDHSVAGNIQNACTLCHGVDLNGSIGVSCLSCHGANPADNPSGCLSCHGQPPLGAAPLGNISPNRSGQHTRAGHTLFISSVPAETCGRCHDGAGFGSANHFDGTNPADVNFIHPDPTDTISAISNAANTTCNGNCHSTFNGADINFNHLNEVWY